MSKISFGKRKQSSYSIYSLQIRESRFVSLRQHIGSKTMIPLSRTVPTVILYHVLLNPSPPKSGSRSRWSRRKSQRSGSLTCKIIVNGVSRNMNSLVNVYFVNLTPDRVSFMSDSRSTPINTPVRFLYGILGNFTTNAS